MSKFKVGDRARVVHIRIKLDASAREGMQVVIVAIERGLSVAGNPYEYIVGEPGVQGFGFVMGWQLEPLTPDLGSWEEIARLTKWKPEGVLA